MLNLMLPHQQVCSLQGHCHITERVSHVFCHGICHKAGHTLCGAEPGQLAQLLHAQTQMKR